MKKIELEEKYILEYIKDILNDSRIKSEELDLKKLFHHNTSYKDTPSVIRNGILSLEDLTKKDIYKFSKEQLEIYSDHTSHVNGIEKISLAKVGLDDIYPNEEVYDPYRATLTDILIDDKVKAGRSSYNYGNEFLADSPILSDKFKSIDIRLLKLINELENKILNNKVDENDITKIIEKYNMLKEIANAISYMKLTIPIRDMSRENVTLDVEKVKENPVLLLKK